MTLKEIEKKIAKTTAIIKKCKNDISVLTCEDAITSAIRSGDKEEYERLYAICKENKETVARLSEKHFYNNVLLLVLRENWKALFFENACNVLEKAFAPFDGKQYGEKTKEKVHNIAHENGFSFYFDGFSGDWGIVVYPYNEHKTGDNINGYARTLDNSTNDVFITADNKVNFNHVLCKCYNHFVDDPEKRAKEIIRLYRKIQETENNLEKLHSEYRHMIPEKGLPDPDYLKKLSIRF